MPKFLLRSVTLKIHGWNFINCFQLWTLPGCRNKVIQIHPSTCQMMYSQWSGDFNAYKKSHNVFGKVTIAQNTHGIDGLQIRNVKTEISLVTWVSNVPNLLVLLESLTWIGLGFYSIFLLLSLSIHGKIEHMSGLKLAQGDINLIFAKKDFWEHLY